MTTIAEPAHRTFSMPDQRSFADFSEDRNPLHMDAVMARRSMAGAPVVHGMHILLWSLEAALAVGSLPQNVQSIRCRFQSPLLVGEKAELSIPQTAAQPFTMRVTVDGTVQSKIEVREKNQIDAAPEPVEDPALIFKIPSEPLECSLENASGRSGRWLMGEVRSDAYFPLACGAIGASRVRAIGFLSALVGMICPGLHSLLGSVTIDLDGPQTPWIDFRVVEADDRFGRILLHVAGGGIRARAETFIRPAPVLQRSLEQLSSLVTPNEFATATALIVGGSRGLGALTAKILAAGGAHIVLSYVAGAQNAQQVQREIEQSGGVCQIVKFDVTQDSFALPAGSAPPTHVYYYATPKIWLRKSRRFSPGRFSHFSAYYVCGMEKLVYTLDRYGGAPVKLFNPSSISIADGPAELTEYSMAKAAAEVLASHLSRSTNVQIVTCRLPRLLTDQTATSHAVKTDETAGVLLPLIREFQNGASSR